MTQSRLMLPMFAPDAARKVYVAARIANWAGDIGPAKSGKIALDHDPG